MRSVKHALDLTSCFGLVFILVFLQGTVWIFAQHTILLDPLTPIFGHRYYVRATLELTLPDPTIFQQEVIFRLINKGRTCKVSNWKDCALNPVARKVWSCNCSSRVQQGNKRFYRFDFLLDTIDDTYNAEQVKLNFHNLQEQLFQLRIVKFSKIPTVAKKKVLNCCDKEETELHWELLTTNYLNRIDVASISWYRRSKADVTNNKPGVEVASVGSSSGPKTATSGGNQTTIDTTHFKVKAGDPNGLKRLIVICDNSLNENEIAIKVTFDKTKFLKSLSPHARSRVARSATRFEKPSTLDSLTALYKNIDALALLAQIGPGTGQLGPSFPTQTQIPMTSPGQTTPGQITPATTPACQGGQANVTCATPTTQAPTTTTTAPSTTTALPKVNYPKEDTQLFELLDSVSLIPKVPPAFTELDLQVRKVSTERNTVLVTCQLRAKIKDKALGFPPANVTLFKQIGKATPKLLGYRSDTKVTHPSENEKDLKFICGVRGSAMDCLKQDNKMRKNVSKNSALITDEIDTYGEIDFFYVLYAAEVFVVLTLMLWTVGNLMEHIRLLMRQTRMKKDQKLQAEVLKKHMNFGSRFQPT